MRYTYSTVHAGHHNNIAVAHEGLQQDIPLQVSKLLVCGDELFTQERIVEHSKRSGNRVEGLIC